MGELDVSHFRKIRSVDHLNGGSADTSTDAPARPQALNHPSDPNDQEEVLNGEISNSSLTLYSPPVPSTRSQLQPYQRIDFSKTESRQELMAELNGILPLNEFNLPRYFYRADLLDFRKLATLYDNSLHRTSRDDSATPPTTNFPPEQGEIEGAHQSASYNGSDNGSGKDPLQEELESATIHLDYHQGYPTLKEGLPFWTQLGYETAEAFGAFADYLSRPGVRTFQGMHAYHTSLLTEWFHTYCWSFRARAYDMFRMTHHSRMRARRIMDTEDNHYIESQRIFGALVKAFGTKTAEELSLQEPKAIVDMLEKVVKIQRVSAGLPALGITDPSKDNQPLSLEVQMRQIAQKDGSDRPVDESFDTLALLQSPDALQTAQELIIKVNRK